jgi:NTE family protein
LDRKRALSLVDFTLSSNGVIKADRFISEIKKFIPDTNIENLNIPLTIIATDMKNKKEKVIEKGSLWEAIRASISIPMIITPAKMDDELFVDGGVLNPVPTNRVFRQEGDKLIAVNVNAQIPFNSEEFHLPTEEIGIMSKVRHIFPTSKAGPGYFQMVSNTSAMMVSQIANLTLQLYPPDILISISGQSCSTFDFHKANGMVSIGKIVTSECLENYHKNK